jgi:hypothetical protein
MAEYIDAGIDFGTTNCTAGLLRSDGEIVGGEPMPSLGAWSNGKVVFGSEAVKLIQSGDETVFPIRDLKLLLGTEKRLHAGGVTLDPVELATRLFESIEDRFFPGRQLRNAVIGTPVRMSRAHRADLRKAAINAGWEKVDLVYEPTAALIGQGDLDSLQGLNYVLVVDWGGGTLDIAVVRVNGGVFREVAVAGDIADLGGSFLDAEIARSLLEQHPGLNESSFSPSDFDRFKFQVEQEKIDVFEDYEGENGDVRRFPFYIQAARKNFRIEPKRLYKLATEFSQKACEQILIMLKRARINPNQISHLLICGGTSKAEVIRQTIKDAFPNTIEIPTETPQRLTGRGCGQMIRDGFTIQLAADFATRQADDSLCVVLRRGQEVALNRYRTADFLVTDILADEAYFEFGICNIEDVQQSMMMAEKSGFVPLGNMFVRTAKAKLAGGTYLPDTVRANFGVDENLTVAVHLRSHGGGKDGGSCCEFFSGVPLAVSLGRSTKEHS